MHVESYLPEELHVAVGMMLPARFTNEFFCQPSMLPGSFTTEFVVCCIVFEEQLFLCKIKILPDIWRKKHSFYVR